MQRFSTWLDLKRCPDVTLHGHQCHSHVETTSILASEIKYRYDVTSVLRYLLQLFMRRVGSDR